MLIKKILHIVLATAFILLIPLVLQLTIGTGVDGQGFNWKLGDFVVMGTLIFGTGLTYELVVKRVKNTEHRVILAIMFVVAFLLVWAELAVGLFGTPFAGS